MTASSFGHILHSLLLVFYNTDFNLTQSKYIDHQNVVLLELQHTNPNILPFAPLAFFTDQAFVLSAFICVHLWILLSLTISPPTNDQIANGHAHQKVVLKLNAKPKSPQNLYRR